MNIIFPFVFQRIKVVQFGGASLSVLLFFGMKHLELPHWQIHKIEVVQFGGARFLMLLF